MAGSVDGSLMFSYQGPGTARFLPIHPAQGGTEVIGYWVAGFGWVTPTQAEAAKFDVGILKATVSPPYPVRQPSPGPGSP